MNTCKTCVYWDDKPAWAMMSATRYCECPKLAENYGQNSPESDDMLIYSYHEGGSFMTGPDFGCVHHKAVSLSTDK